MRSYHNFDRYNIFLVAKKKKKKSEFSLLLSQNILGIRILERF